MLLLLSWDHFWKPFLPFCLFRTQALTVIMRKILKFLYIELSSMLLLLRKLCIPLLFLLSAQLFLKLLLILDVSRLPDPLSQTALYISQLFLSLHSLFVIHFGPQSRFFHFSCFFLSLLFFQLSSVVFHVFLQSLDGGLVSLRFYLTLLTPGLQFFQRLLYVRSEGCDSLGLPFNR